MKLKLDTASVFSDLKILYHQGKQYIPDLTTVEVPGIFRGRPVISATGGAREESAVAAAAAVGRGESAGAGAAAAAVGNEESAGAAAAAVGRGESAGAAAAAVGRGESAGAGAAAAAVSLCPVGAISEHPLSIDMGKCLFCGECERKLPSIFHFTKDYKMASATREGLIVTEGRNEPMVIHPEQVRKEIKKLFGNSLKLRQVSAGGDNSCEWELNASGNVNFDMGRFGIEFVASPRHANGIVITGPITRNMAGPLQICYDAVPKPKIIILAGTDAISGGIYADSPAIDRSFLNKYTIDLYVPGNPVHPLTFINGLLGLLRGKKI